MLAMAISFSIRTTWNMILLFTENEKIWMRKMPNDKNIIDGKIYKIYMQMYDPDEIDIPWWGTCNL
jgi:hypothetical protein